MSNINVDSKLLTVKISCSIDGDRFFIDLWEAEKYVVSVKLSRNVAEGISRETGIKILVQ